MNKFLTSVCAAALIAGPAFAQSGPQPITPIATTTLAGKVQPDGSTITITAAGVISSSGGGSGCTVGGTVNQIVSNNGSTGCQASTATATTGGTIIVPGNGASSLAALEIDGTIFTGGSGTTTFPLFLINPAASAATTWSTSGTILGINGPSGFAGNIVDIKENNSAIYSCTGSTCSFGANVTMSASGIFSWSTHGILTSPNSGNVQLGAADAASPVAQTLSAQSVSTGTSNTAGAATVIQGSRGTGTGVGGSVSIATAPAGSTGSTQNAAINGFTLDTTQFAILGAGTPTCGTGCSSIGAGATNQRMVITTGAAVTSISVNFSKTLTSTPICILTMQSATPVGAGFSAESTAGFTITALSALTSGVINVLCQ